MSAAQTAKVIIYTTAYCGYCHAAKRLLDSRSIAYDEVTVDRRPDLRRWLVGASNQRTVPQIFINGSSVGGYTELAGLDRSGRLKDQLAATPSPNKIALPR